MRLVSAAVIVASVALSAGSQVLLKGGMSAESIQIAIKNRDPAMIAFNVATSPLVLSGLGCFAFSLLLWLFILSQLPLSSAYPFVSLGIVLTALAGFTIFSEPISLTKAIGVGLIMSGVILVGIDG
jgi:multidrug transporter EmrE-like cation transporter